MNVWWPQNLNPNHLVLDLKNNNIRFTWQCRGWNLTGHQKKKKKKRLHTCTGSSAAKRNIREWKKREWVNPFWWNKSWVLIDHVGDCQPQKNVFVHTAQRCTVSLLARWRRATWWPSRRRSTRWALTSITSVRKTSTWMDRRRSPVCLAAAGARRPHPAEVSDVL